MFFFPHQWAEEEYLRPQPASNPAEGPEQAPTLEQASTPEQPPTPQSEEASAPRPPTPSSNPVPSFSAGEVPLDHPNYRSGGFVLIQGQGRGRMFPYFRQPSQVEIELGRMREDYEHAQMVFDHFDSHAEYLEEIAEKAELLASQNRDDENAQQEAESARFWADDARDEADREGEYAEYLADLVKRLEAQFELEKLELEKAG